MDFFFNKFFQEIVSLSIVLCLFIHNTGSKHDRESITSMLTLFHAIQFTLITSVRDFGEFLGTFRFAATECYLKI